MPPERHPGKLLQHFLAGGDKSRFLMLQTVPSALVEAADEVVHLQQTGEAAPEVPVVDVGAFVYLRGNLIQSIKLPRNQAKSREEAEDVPLAEAVVWREGFTQRLVLPNGPFAMCPHVVRYADHRLRYS